MFLEIWILEDEDRFYAEGFKFDCETKGFGWGDFEFSNGEILVVGKFLRVRQGELICCDSSNSVITRTVNNVLGRVPRLLWTT